MTSSDQNKVPEIINALNDKHRSQLEVLAKFCNLDGIKFIDRGDAESYELIKDGRSLFIVAASSQDSGFLEIKGWLSLR